jgi:predicted ATP-grasp superfamily ATP-dependent carboligase
MFRVNRSSLDLTEWHGHVADEGVPSMAARPNGKRGNIAGAKKPERVLVIGDDMRIFLAVVRSLGRAGKEVHAAPFNWHSPALKSRYISVVHHFPRYSDDPAGWLAAIREVVRVNAFELVVPCCDRAILPLNVHREDFLGTRVAIPNPTEMTVLFDKECTHLLCEKLGVPVVPGARVSASDTATDLVARYGLPLVVKPRKSYWLDRLDSYGKASIVESEEELQQLLGTLDDPSRYLVEAYFEGVGVGVSVLAKDGNILHAFQHRRLRESRGGSSSYRVSEPINDELYLACEKICQHTKLTGVCMFEFRYNPDSRKWILLETNARFWGSLPLPLSLGLDFPRYLYDLLVHDIQHTPVSYKTGVRSRNFVLDGFNLLAGLRVLRWGGIRRWFADLTDFLMQPVRWSSGRERSDTFVADDFSPALWECFALVNSVRQKQTRNGKPSLHRRHSEQAI